jgi:hypothetical protein
MTRALLLWCVLSALPAFAHDSITAETAEGYLARQAAFHAVIASSDPLSERAAAWLNLGSMLDEIGDLLNRDLEAHGRVQGLASNFLMAELRARGSPLAWSADRGHFDANLKYYREALKLSNAPAIAGEATFRLLQGWFYDSFTVDPLEPAAQTPAQLAEQVRLGETFRQKYPGHAGREEATFILVVHYIQSARAAAQPKQRQAFALKARALGEEFLTAYPDSLRAAAIPPLLERLPPPHPAPSPP